MNIASIRRKKILIIGAGFSGRGFIGRLLHENGCRITFADINESLVRKLQNAKEYNIYLGAERKRYKMDGFEACHIEERAALDAAVEADYIFVSIGEENLKNLKDFFQKLSLLKDAAQIQVVVCENGLAPKKVLKDALQDTAARQMLISQAVIFCTTISNDKGVSLNILSEDYNSLPYDIDEGLFKLPFEHFVPETHFDLLLKRKIYTYNCLSACIAYLGYCKGYTNYADAANDNEIKELCHRLKGNLDDVLSREFGVTFEEQSAFSKRALDKFCDRTIVDTIYKNVRNAVRKLAPEERLIGPLRIMIENGKNCDDLCKVIAAALRYLKNEECMKYEGVVYSDIIEFFSDISQYDINNEVVGKISSYYEKLD